MIATSKGWLAVIYLKYVGQPSMEAQLYSVRSPDGTAGHADSNPGSFWRPTLHLQWTG